MCALDCRVRLELFVIWIWEPLSSTHLNRPLLMAMKKLSLTTKHRALGFQTDGWSCGFQRLNIAKLAVEHRGSFSSVPLVPTSPGLVDYVLGIANADRAVQVGEAPCDDVEGVTELPCPPESPPTIQVEDALSAIEESSGQPHHYRPPRHLYGANIMACSCAQPLVHQTSGEKYSPQNMHPLQVVAECTLVDQVSFCVAGGLCTKIAVKLTSGTQLRY